MDHLLLHDLQADKEEPLQLLPAGTLPELVRLALRVAEGLVVVLVGDGGNQRLVRFHRCLGIGWTEHRTDVAVLALEDLEALFLSHRSSPLLRPAASTRR